MSPVDLIKLNNFLDSLERVDYDNGTSTQDLHKEYTPDEDDLVPLTLNAAPDGGRYQLEFNDSVNVQNLKIWTSPDKDFVSLSDAHVLGGYPSGTTTLSRIGNATIIDASETTTFWVEGVSPGAGTMMLKWRSNSGNYGYADKLVINVMQLDLNIDSNNDGSIDQNDGPRKDDPSLSGKVVIADTLDYNGDNIPGYAEESAFSHNPGNQPTPITLTISDNIDLATAQIRFNYDGADPALVKRNGSTDPNSTTNADRLDVYNSGTLSDVDDIRIWNSNTTFSTDGINDGGDYVTPDADISTAKIFSGGSRTVTLYLEGIKPTGTDGEEIKVEVDPHGVGDYELSDQVRVTVATLQIVYTDVSGISHEGGNPDLPVNIDRISRTKQPDGVATDWQQGVDDGAMLLVRVIGSPILNTLANQGKLHFALGMVGSGVDPGESDGFETLPGDGNEGYLNAADSFAAALSSLEIPITGLLETGIQGVDYNADSGLTILQANLYRPPTEFAGAMLEDGSQADRQIHLAVNVSGGLKYSGAKPGALFLTRPPLVLVNGIGNTTGADSYWQGSPALGDGTTPEDSLGYLAFLANNSVQYGEGELRTAYTVVPDAINAALSSFRNGSYSHRQYADDPLIGTDALANDGQHMLIAVQKADIIAHSYGGLLARWYVEQGNIPGETFSDRRDVRKLIELGTPNLGSPLANMADEAADDTLVGDGSLNIITPIPLGPLGYLNPALSLYTNMGLLSILPAGYSLPIFTATGVVYPFFRDAAVDSSALQQLNANPFNPDVAYGSVYGLSGTYYGLNLYSIFEPVVNGGNAFPYMNLMSASANDGIVPQWSASLGLESAAVIDNHTGLKTNAAAFEDINAWLNGYSTAGALSPMPLG